MFLYDKYAPKNELDITFHNEIIKHLIQMSKDSAVPHVLLYGPDGSGKRTIARLFLENIFDDGINDTSDVTYTINGSSNTLSNITIKQSPYHLVIEPTNNNFDKYIVQNIVKEYAKRIPLNVYTTTKSFKIVVINDVEKFSYYAQMSLRRTMEKYSQTCRFLMICNSISKLIEPLRSRCVCIRVPYPTDVEITNTILTICFYEKFDISLAEIQNIISHANGNIKQALWKLEFIVRKIPLNIQYIETINQIIQILITKELSEVTRIRAMIYDIITINIPGRVIIQTIMLKLCEQNEISDMQKYNIIHRAAKYEHKMVIGRREAIQLDCFIVDTIIILSSPDRL